MPQQDILLQPVLSLQLEKISTNILIPKMKRCIAPTENSSHYAILSKKYISTHIRGHQNQSIQLEAGYKSTNFSEAYLFYDYAPCHYTPLEANCSEQVYLQISTHEQINTVIVVQRLVTKHVIICNLYDMKIQFLRRTSNLLVGR